MSKCKTVIKIKKQKKKIRKADGLQGEDVKEMSKQRRMTAKGISCRATELL